jgi:hypothetical protein
MGEVLLQNTSNCERLLNEIFEATTERFYVLEAVVPSPDIMYQMFETLNQRGEKLVVADLFKNLLFERFENRLGEERIEVIWGAFTSAIGDYIDDFLRHYWLSKFRFVRASKLFRAIRDKIAELEDVRQFEEFMAKMTTEAAIYRAIRNPDDNRWRSPETLQLIRELKYLGFKQGLPLLLAVYARFSESEPQKFPALLKAYLNLVVRTYTILEGNPSEFEEDYSQWARELRAGEKTVEQIIAKFREDTPTDADLRVGIVGMNGVSAKDGCYIITKINDAMSNSLIRAWNNSPTVEHVIPQNPDTWWTTFLRSRNLKHKSLVDRLGNLTILSAEDNTDLGNMPYPEKKETYLSMGVPINSATFDGPEFNDFTAATIRRREEVFADLIVQHQLWT